MQVSGYGPYLQHVMRDCKKNPAKTEINKMKTYKDNKLNHVIGVGREDALEVFLGGTYKNINHKRKNSYSSNSEDASTWSCFDIISQLKDAKKKEILDEILDHSFCEKDMKPKKFTFADEVDIEIEIGKVFKALSTNEQTELDASIETKTKIIFIEAKLYSSISLESSSQEFDQIVKKIRVGLDYAERENKEFFFIFLDIAPRSELYKFSTEKKSLENAKIAPTRKWKSVFWFNRYKKNPKILKQKLYNIKFSQSIESVTENMGWLTWNDLFKITMRSLIEK